MELLRVQFWRAAAAAAQGSGKTLAVVAFYSNLRSALHQCSIRGSRTEPLDRRSLRLAGGLHPPYGAPSNTTIECTSSRGTITSTPSAVLLIGSG